MYMDKASMIDGYRQKQLKKFDLIYFLYLLNNFER